MSEEQLNIKYICENTGLVENDKLIPIILGMIKDSYKAGLTQAEIDNTMGLIEENQELKKQLKATEEVAEEHMKKWVTMETQQKEFIKYLEDEISELSVCWKDASCIAEEILSKYKKIIGNNSDVTR